MTLTVKFTIALMGLIAAIISYQTQLLGLGGNDPPTAPSGPVEEQIVPDDVVVPNDVIVPSDIDDGCFLTAAYNACSEFP
ncbi:MAG: hypothetical protein ABWX84_05890 [Nocardioides sp.]